MSDRINSGLMALIANGTVLGVVTLANIELLLKIILLVITIGFTTYQFGKAIRKKDDK